MPDQADEALARRLVEAYSDMLLRLGYSLLGSVPDAQDMCQEVLLKRLAHSGDFESAAHERAWLVRVAVNQCQNLRRSVWRRRTVGLDCLGEQAGFQPEEGGVLEAVLALPERYRAPVHLFYYEGLSTAEIAAVLGKSEGAVRTRLSRARAMLRGALEECENHD